MKKRIEIWADSFHEGSWCCECMKDIAQQNGFAVKKTIVNGFQPKYTFEDDKHILELMVYGSYRSWSPVPPKILDLICWGKPDFIAYDPSVEEILFAVEETAATPTGNQAMQRCERQYGSARLGIPYWYLISEFGVHRDGGVRRDSIWPTIAAIKLSIFKKTPCLVLHYSDIDNPEDYKSGSGVDLLFRSLFQILTNHLSEIDRYTGLQELLTSQYQEMLSFLMSQWESIIDFLPSADLIASQDTARVLAQVSVGNTADIGRIAGLLEWPVISGVPENVRRKWQKKDLLKFDPLCAQMEQDIADGKAYYLSDNAGSGKPPTRVQIETWIRQQNRLFDRAGELVPPASFCMQIDDFPDTGTGTGRRHLTTAKNIVYLYDSWNEYVDTVVKAYPRLKTHLQKKEQDMPVFVYVSNSLCPGRLFGDPFTGQLTAYSTAFGKFDPSPRMVVAYFPHQVHTQALHNGVASTNKGMTLMTELTDYVIFHAGVAVDLSTREVM